jgi:NAD(P)-dependent dehydrogenase (short-subunit alcohol dehydrogenase family)
MNPKDPNGSFVDGRGVLITGCSSGIGRETAVKLAKHGFTVFATVRKEADADNLRNLNIPNLVPICPVDLTNLDHITNAAKTVADELSRSGKKGLHALINNAGGGSPAPVELMKLDQFHRELDLNGNIQLAIWRKLPVSLKPCLNRLQIGF